MDSVYPTIPVLKTTSPEILFTAPNPIPEKTEPSSRTKTAFFCSQLLLISEPFLI
jgi:hypothetical protein